jgi:hypothetical protein
LRGTATALAYGSPETTGSGMVNAPAAVASADQTVDATADPVSAGFASETYPLLFGQPLTWRDLTFNSGVDSSGTPWSAVSWSNVVWDVVTWHNLDWESFNWSAINWQDISWEDISWEGITWEDISWETVPVRAKGKKGQGGWRVLD